MKTAIVTGGSRGIGKVVSRTLHKAGYKIVMVARHAEELEQTAKELGGNAAFFVGNVTDYDSVKKYFDTMDRIDVLVNCAGILGPTEPITDSQLVDWERVININLFGTVNCCKAALSKIEQSPRGKIINISGGGAAFPRPLHSAYATSKAAVVRFTEELAHEVANTDVNVIAPGMHQTKMWDDEKVDEKPDEWSNEEDLANLILFLVSDKSNGITGKFIHIKDTYQNWTPEITKSDMYALRRIDEFLLEKYSKR